MHKSVIPAGLLAITLVVALVPDSNAAVALVGVGTSTHTSAFGSCARDLKIAIAATDSSSSAWFSFAETARAETTQCSVGSGDLGRVIYAGEGILTGSPASGYTGMTSPILCFVTIGPIGPSTSVSMDCAGKYVLVFTFQPATVTGTVSF